MKSKKKALIARAKEGDTEAFGELYSLYFMPVFRYIYYRVHSQEEAEDLVHKEQSPPPRWHLGGWYVLPVVNLVS